VRASVAVCCSGPEAPVNVTVVVPIAAPADADSVMDCGVPGVRFRVAGLAVTPAGRLVEATLTVPEKPLRAVTETEVGWAAPLACRLRLLGLSARKKSGDGGAAATVRANVAVCWSPLAVPVNVTVAVPIAAPADADSMMNCGTPGVRFRVAGLAVTPAGRLARETLTVPENPLTGVAETEACCPDAPA